MHVSICYAIKSIPWHTKWLLVVKQVLKKVPHKEEKGPSRSISLFWTFNKLIDRVLVAVLVIVRRLLSCKYASVLPHLEKQKSSAKPVNATPF